MTKMLNDIIATKLERLLSQDTNTISEKILAPHKNILANLKEVYIFGAKRLGRKVANVCLRSGIDVNAFIDNDPSKQGQFINNIPIIPLQSVSKKAVIIICTTVHWYPIAKQLEEQKYHYISYPLLTLFDSKRFSPELTFEHMQEDIIENADKYFDIFNKLADEKSKVTFSNLIKFRISLNPLESFQNIDDPNDEYFDENILPLTKNEIFIDGGGYVGDTVRRFIDKKKSYKHIYYFEPDRDLFLQAKEELENQNNVTFANCGLYSRSATLSFNLTGDVDGFIDPDGEFKIEAVALDDFVKEKITFIKLDVEGAEQEAIKGAEKHISSERPKMAVAIYHKPSDLWKIPVQISSINDKYKYYLRHYSQTSLDTVLYCVPK